MIATIRVRTNGNSKFLCNLDLLKHSEEAVLERMEERGIREDSFFICGFSDWGTDTILSLKQAYTLRKCVLELYDGDDSIVRHLLKRHKPFSFVISHYYRFVTKDEVELMKRLLQGVELEKVIELFYHSSSWVGAVQAYVEQDIVLNTNQGFYLDSEYL